MGRLGKMQVVLTICTMIIRVQTREALYSIDCREGLTLDSDPLEGEPSFKKHGGVYRLPTATPAPCGFRFQALGTLWSYIDKPDWIPTLNDEIQFTPMPGTPAPEFLRVCKLDTKCVGCYKEKLEGKSSKCLFKIWMKHDSSVIIHMDICNYNEQYACKETCDNGQV